MKTIDKVAKFLIDKAKEDGVELAWDRLEKQQPQCGFGTLGICCRNCAMGPCRIDPFPEGPKKGVCGADADHLHKTETFPCHLVFKGFFYIFISIYIMVLFKKSFQFGYPLH